MQLQAMRQRFLQAAGVLLLLMFTCLATAHASVHQPPQPANVASLHLHSYDCARVDRDASSLPSAAATEDAMKIKNLSARIVHFNLPDGMVTIPPLGTVELTATQAQAAKQVLDGVFRPLVDDGSLEIGAGGDRASTAGASTSGESSSVPGTQATPPNPTCLNPSVSTPPNPTSTDATSSSDQDVGKRAAKR